MDFTQATLERASITSVLIFGIYTWPLLCGWQTDVQFCYLYIHWP